MKKLTTLLFVVLAQCSLMAQCTQNVSAFGNNTNVPSYNISGDVSVTLNTDQTVTLELKSNFMTGSGPDIRAYLLNSNGLSDAQIRSSTIDQLEYFEFGLVGATGATPPLSQNGAKSFTVPIPSSANIQDYDKVFFYCFEFDAFWDFGSFDSFSTSNCTVLSTETFTHDELAIFPNPVREQLHVVLKQLDTASLKFYSLDGQLLRTIPQIARTNSRIDMSAMNSGLYLLEITSHGRTGYQTIAVH